MTEHRPSFYDWTDAGVEEIPFMDAVKAGHIPIVGFTDEGLPIALDKYNKEEHPIDGLTAHERMELRTLWKREKGVAP